MASFPKAKPYLLALFLIFTVCFLAYFNSLHSPFIWDDEGLIVKNTLIRSPENVPASFTNDLFFGITSGSNFYRPLQTISYIFDYHFWQLDPYGYHLTNVVLQSFVSFLVFLLIYHFSMNFAVACAGGLFFSVSPIHSESVSYISGRAEMLMGFFLILSFLFFIKSRELKKSTILYILSLISFIFALLSKELAVVFPLVVSGYIVYFLKDRFKQKYYFIKNVSGFFIISFLYLALRSSVLNFSTLRAPSLTNVPLFIRLSVLPKVIFTYLKLLLLPVDLHMSRELARPHSPAGIVIAYFFLALIIFICVYFLKSGKNKVISFMLFWSLAFFIPQSGIFPINAFVAEHFIYLPSISFFMFLAYILHKYLRKSLFILSAVLICLFYIILCAGRNFEWQKPVLFYKNIIKYSPDSFQAHNNLGLQYEYLGRFDEALAHYKRALEIKPDLIEARSNLANLYFKLKLHKEAKEEYERLERSELGAKAGEVRNNMGNIYEAQGDFNGAILKYNQALKLDPGLKFTHFNLARIYLSRGDIDSAAKHIEESLSIVNNSQISKIITYFFKTKGVLPGAAEFYNDLGIEFAKNKYWPQALQAFNLALELKPESSDYYYNLGLAYLNTGKKNKAKNAFKSALKINPNHIAAKRLMAK